MEDSSWTHRPPGLGVGLPRLVAALVVVLGMIIGAMTFSGPAHAAVSGPCDIYAAGGTPCVAAHSTVRALYGAYNGSLYQVRRSSDGTTANIGVLSAGGTKYYLEPGVTDPTSGKSYGVSELQGLKATRIFDPIANTWKNLAPAAKPTRPRFAGGAGSSTFRSDRQSGRTAR